MVNGKFFSSYWRPAAAADASDAGLVRRSWRPPRSSLSLAQLQCHWGTQEKPTGRNQQEHIKNLFPDLDLGTHQKLIFRKCLLVTSKFMMDFTWVPLPPERLADRLLPADPPWPPECLAGKIPGIHWDSSVSPSQTGISPTSCSNSWPFPIFSANKALQQDLPQLLPRAFGMMNQETIHGLHTAFLAGFLPQSQAAHGSCDRSGLR